MLKLLIVEGSSEKILVGNEADGRQFGCEVYRDALRHNAPDAIFHFAFPYAVKREKDLLPLIAYDGFAFTGSGVPWGAEMPEAKPYLDYIERILKTGKPVLGSCWGMQTVCVLLGGMSGPNSNGSELGVARNISLTGAGKNHQLFEGMAEIFASPTMHRDHVTRLPYGATLLASNPVSEVQAMAYDLNGIDYMGFQFHPEVPVEYFREIHDKFPPLPGTLRELADFPDQLPPEIADVTMRTRPLANWLNHVRKKSGITLRA